MDDEKLIAAVRARTFIYNKNEKNHSNRDIISAAWDSIALEAGENVTAADCRCRWASMRDHFRKKHRELTTTASGQAASKKRKWYLYDLLTFLTPACSTGATCGNLQHEHEVINASSGDEKSQTSPLSVLPDESSLPVSTSKPIKKSHRNSKRKEQLSAIDREVLQALKEPGKEADDNELFFKSLLPAMKTLDVIRTLELRSEIQRLVLSYVRSGQSGTTAGTTAVEASHAGLVVSPPASASATNAMNYRIQDSQDDTCYSQD